ncbi:MAG: DUF4827 family protein, partial [Bacteroidota bacterium]|nr:DUF4827 family protein [Bacteroidota bacterium]
MNKQKEYIISFIVLLLCMITIFSCSFGVNEDYAVGENPQENAIKSKQNQINSSLANANKIISDREKQRIEAFIQRRGWQMDEVAGVYLQILEQGRGKITTNNVVTVEYKSYYLNGKSADDFIQEEKKQEGSPNFSNNKTQKTNNFKTFSLQGDTYVVYGLAYAVQHLRKNSIARIIVPDNLAFYMNDSGEKIKANATLVYEIKIIE